MYDSAVTTALEEVTTTLNGVPAVEIKSELDRILCSRAFIQSHRIRRFLQFVVEESLLGQPHRLKEYLIGLEVFDRREAFDPRVDSIVRVEARRLRNKLEEYFQTEGQEDPVRVLLRKGSYVPIFEYRPADTASSGRLASGQDSRDAYLQGRYCWKLATPDTIRNSVSHFTRAVENDENYAAAWAALAEGLTVSSIFGCLAPIETGRRMREAALKARSLNGALPETHIALGLVLSILDWDWEAGERELQKAIQLDNHDPIGHIAYGVQLACRGRLDRAIVEVERALELDPASLFPNFILGWLYGVCGRWDEAISQHLLVSRLAPDYALPHFGLGLAHAGQGMFQDAIAHFNDAAQLKCHSLLGGQLGYCYAMDDRPEEALREIDDLTARSGSHYVSPVCFASIYCGLEDRENAQSCLEQALEGPDPSLPLQLLNPEFDSLRNESRFQALRRQIGLQPT